jgi:hypothetical protein
MRALDRKSLVLQMTVEQVSSHVATYFFEQNSDKSRSQLLMSLKVAKAYKVF